MKGGRVMRWGLAIVLTALVTAIIEIPTLGFWSGYHYDASYSVLNEWHLGWPTTLGVITIPKYSNSAATLLAFFSIEVDLSDSCEEYRRCAICWPGHDVPWWCLGRSAAGRPFGLDVCQGSLKYWADHVLPFHSPGTRAAYGLVERLPEPDTGVEKESVTDLWWGAGGSQEARKAMEHYVLHDAVHPRAGEHPWLTMERFGHALHGIQDFYSHSNWVRVFYENPHIIFKLSEIPSWTAFWKAQRGSYDFQQGNYGRNLIVWQKALEQASGDKTQAGTYHGRFMAYLQKAAAVCCHGGKYSFYDGIPPSCYGFAVGVGYSSEDVALVTRSVQLAWEESMYWAHQLKLNTLRSPKLGAQVWNSLNHLESTDSLWKYVSAMSRFRKILSFTDFFGWACWH